MIYNNILEIVGNTPDFGGIGLYETPYTYVDPLRFRALHPELDGRELDSVIESIYASSAVSTVLQASSINSVNASGPLPQEFRHPETPRAAERPSGGSPATAPLFGPVR